VFGARFAEDARMQIEFVGIGRTTYDELLEQGVDAGGNRIDPFVDEAGGWPLRCCLGVSEVGDRIAIVACSPFSWDGAYRETGPIVIHVDGCRAPGTRVASLPQPLNDRPMVLRPYTHDHRIHYDLVTHVDERSDVGAHVAALLAHDDVAEVHGRNRTGGCYAFTARRT
jgi:hypothetical protein